MFERTEAITPFEIGLSAIDFSAEDAIRDAFGLLCHVRGYLDANELMARIDYDKWKAIRSFAGRGQESTHYKTWVYGEGEHPDDGANVWLHDYTGNVAPGTLVARPHDHRADIAILVGNGGYKHTIYAPAEDGPVTAAYETMVQAGTTYWLSADQVHSVSEVQPGTVTVMIQGRPQRNYSHIHLPDGTVEVAYANRDFPSRKQHIEMLTDLANSIPAPYRSRP